MEIFELLETIEILIENSKTVPFFSKKKMVDADDIKELINEIKNKMPDELKQARWIKEERTRILQEAQRESEATLVEAERRIIEMIDEHEITKKAILKSEKIIEEAKLKSREISEGTIIYADTLLQRVEESIRNIQASMQDGEAHLEGMIHKLNEDREDLNK